MTINELREKIQQWDSENLNNEALASAKYTSLLAQIEYHAVNEWNTYVPTKHMDYKSNYLERLAGWIGNVTSEKDQKLLLEYALQISYFSHDDFISLYHTALNREVFHWIAHEVGARLDLHGAQGFNDQVYREIHDHTWFCPITDSLDINEFYKANHITGKTQRPSFATIQKIPEHETNSYIRHWISYMNCPDGDPSKPLNRLVLLEDIVGSGSQCLPAVRMAVEKFCKPVLFVPLILCPNGAEVLREEENNSNGLLSVKPVVELSRSDLLGPERKQYPAWTISEELEQLAKFYAPRASRCMDTFGYENTGCSIATYSNTPDNTLPIVHNKPRNEDWEPLYPRVARE